VKRVLADIASETTTEIVGVEIVVSSVAVVIGNQVTVDPQIASIIECKAVKESGSSTTFIICERVSQYAKTSAIV
jgi:hypothetical protein